MSINLTKTTLIDITKKYRTRDAKWPVTIVSTSGPYSGFPVVGYAHSTSIPLLCHWSEVGGYPANTNLDLIEVREPQIVRLIMPAPGNRKYQPDYIDWPASERLSIDPTLQTSGNWIVRRFIEILDEPTP